MNDMKVRNSCKSLKISEILTVSKFVPENAPEEAANPRRIKENGRYKYV